MSHFKFQSLFFCMLLYVVTYCMLLQMLCYYKCLFFRSTVQCNIINAKQLTGSSIKWLSTCLCSVVSCCVSVTGCWNKSQVTEWTVYNTKALISTQNACSSIVQQASAVLLISCFKILWGDVLIKKHVRLLCLFTHFQVAHQEAHFRGIP